MAKNPKRPRDPNQLGKLIADIAIGDITEEIPKSDTLHAGQRRGGLRGGKARAASLSPKKRKEIAQKAAKKRWENKN